MNDILAQERRINRLLNERAASVMNRIARNPMLLSDRDARQIQTLTSRARRVRDAASLYTTRIMLSGSYQRSALAGNQAKADTRGYSRRTYMGLNQG